MPSNSAMAEETAKLINDSGKVVVIAIELAGEPELKAQLDEFERTLKHHPKIELQKTFRSFVKDLIGAVAVTCVVVWLFNGFTSLQRFDELLYALRFPTGDSASPDILLVEITRETLKFLGDWPIDRFSRSSRSGYWSKPILRPRSQWVTSPGVCGQ